ncbi:shTK domain protein [Oesophagostomum dentatum]|uniref:ShTK domain protein n=1 Tax=Oesophagostomum dentatum TaxID=61180 RepID=A0A0B1TJX2_OESDE|nr:shTK domain protein [Oesophagostomum dentatum]
MLVYSCILYSALYIAQISAQTCSDAGGGREFTQVEDAFSNATAASTVTVASAATVASTVTATTAATCVDKLNPSTGKSDCPARASLCNDATYYAVMTEQCPKTCGRCSGSTTSTATCVDKTNPSTGVSDCPALSYLCNNAAYLTLMTEQCPKTCNRCSSTGATSATGASSATTVSSTTCVDKLNPRTGTSDCPMRVSLCQDANYLTLMKTECPKTCGYCTSSTVSGATVASTVSSATATTRAAGTCVDAINPRTGTSDCPQRASLCNDSVYKDLMSNQCPKTCGLC